VRKQFSVLIIQACGGTRVSACKAFSISRAAARSSKASAVEFDAMIFPRAFSSRSRPWEEGYILVRKEYRTRKQRTATFMSR
jgi:hypothetical protein